MRICVLGAASSAHVVARAKVFETFGHEVTLLSPATGDALGLETKYCARDGQGKLAWLKSIYDAVKWADADIFHAHYAAELTTWMASILGKRPLVITVMGGDVLFDEQGSLGPVGRWLTKRAILKADLVTVKSPMLGDVVASWGVPKDRIMNIVWGVDGRVFAPDTDGAKQRRSDWGVQADDKILFSPRMLKPLYNQVLMVEALAQIPNAILVLSTYQEDQTYRTEVEAKAKALNVLDRVKFVPALSMTDMSASYCAADVILSLPPSDGTPQSVMEAMACGAPVVQTDLDRFKPLFAHQESCWFTHLNADAVAEGTNALLNDETLRTHISKTGQAVVLEKADFESQAREVETRLLTLVGQG